MAETLEEKLNSEKNEDKPKEISLGESAGSEIDQASRGLVNSAIGLGAIGVATKFFGLDGLVTALSFPVGGMIESKLANKPFTSKNFRDEAIAGTLFTVPLWYGVNALRSLTTSPLTVGALTFASVPLFNAIYYPLKYLVDNKTFKGMTTDFKKYYWKGTKRGLILGVPWAGAVAASVAYPVLYPFLFPILAGFEVAYRVILSKENLNYAKLLNPFTYIPNFVNPFYIASGLGTAAGKVYRGTTTAVYDLGAAVRDSFKKIPAPTTTPAPAAAAHP